MKEHRDSPEIEPDKLDAPRASSTRRFARLIESPASRRVALPRLIATVGVALGILGLAWVVVDQAVRSVVGWVDSLPDQKISFSKIELVPEPPPWFVTGAAGILEHVRSEAKHGEDLRLLSLDLDALRADFKRCPWVKRVSLVERSHGRLAVHLEYRKPVAVVELKRDLPNVYVIDEEGVPLPPVDIDWTSKTSPFRVKGISGHLIKIKGVSTTTEPRFGVPWKRDDPTGSLDDRDPMVLGAARLAEFLQSQTQVTPKGQKAPDFVSIWLPDEPIESYFLADPDQNWVQWGKAPGSERPGDLPAIDRWKMLLDWVDRHGPIEAKSPNFLHFTRSGMELVWGSPTGKKPAGPR